MPEDHELFSRVKEGDSIAFQQLFERYYSGLLGFGIYLTKNQEISRGLIQEIFLTLWERKDTLTVTSVKAYLFTAMNHKALNYLRHRKVVLAMEASPIHPDQSSEPPQEKDPFLKDALERAINDLPEKARECFRLTQIDGLSAKEAAVRLNVSIKTIENQLTRSKKILRKKLRSYR